MHDLSFNNEQVTLHHAFVRCKIYNEYFPRTYILFSNDNCVYTNYLMIISDVALYLFVSLITLMNTVIAYSEFNNERDDLSSSGRSIYF